MESLCNDVTRYFLNYTNSRVTLAFSALNGRCMKLTCEPRYMDSSQQRLPRYAKIEHHFYGSVSYTIMPYLPSGYVHGKCWTYDLRNLRGSREANYWQGLLHGRMVTSKERCHYQNGIPLSNDNKLTPVREVTEICSREAEVLEELRTTGQHPNQRRNRELRRELSEIKERKAQLIGLHPLRANIHEIKFGYEGREMHSVRVM